ncbi:hypothetical protein CKO27_16330 [Thiocystis violacea]|nr:hypothetical protein [Thiocystis violacea]
MRPTRAYADALAQALDDVLDLLDPDGDEPDNGVQIARATLASFDQWRAEQDGQTLIPIGGGATTRFETPTVGHLAKILAHLPPQAPLFGDDSQAPEIRLYVATQETAPNTQIFAEIG